MGHCFATNAVDTEIVSNYIWLKIGSRVLLMAETHTLC